MLFSAENGFKNIGGRNDQLILEAAHHGVVVTLLAPMDQFVKKVQKNLKTRNGNISIKSIKPYSSSINRKNTPINSNMTSPKVYS